MTDDEAKKAILDELKRNPRPRPSSISRTFIRWFRI